MYCIEHQIHQHQSGGLYFIQRTRHPLIKLNDILKQSVSIFTLKYASILLLEIKRTRLKI